MCVGVKAEFSQKKKINYQILCNFILENNINFTTTISIFIMCYWSFLWCKLYKQIP